jgi:hypothetical protein
VAIQRAAKCWNMRSTQGWSLPAIDAGAVRKAETPLPLGGIDYLLCLVNPRAMVCEEKTWLPREWLIG